MTTKRFPIMESPAGGPRSIPWAMLEPQEDQAIDNHGQALKRLAERGGLCPAEALAVLRGVKWHAVQNMTRERATSELVAMVEQFEARQAPNPIDAAIHHACRLVNARISDMADKFLGLQPAESKPLELLEKLSGWVDRLQFDVSQAAAAELANEWVSADSERPPAGTDIRFRVGGGSYTGRLISLPYGEFMRSDSGDFALHIVKWQPRIGAAETVVPGAEPPPASEPETESWWYARHPDDERWEGGCPSREDAIAEAFSGTPDPNDVCYVVRGERPTTAQFAACIGDESILDQLINYGSDNGLLGDDHELEFSDAAACERELQVVVAKYLVRPLWWVCDGSQAEAVTFEEFTREQIKP